MKEYLGNPHLLSQLVEGEALYLYLAVSPSAISSTLIREEQGVHRLVYFTSTALHGAEERYPRIEKLAFALINSARRLRPYFQAHTIKGLTKHPLRKILQNLNLLGRLVSWAIELGEFDIEFHLRTSLNGQVLADIFVEFCNFLEEEELPQGETWVACMDGSSTQKYSGVSVILREPSRETYEAAI